MSTASALEQLKELQAQLSSLEQLDELVTEPAGADAEEDAEIEALEAQLSKLSAMSRALGRTLESEGAPAPEPPQDPELVAAMLRLKGLEQTLSAASDEGDMPEEEGGARGGGALEQIQRLTEAPLRSSMEALQKLDSRMDS